MSNEEKKKPWTKVPWIIFNYPFFILAVLVICCVPLGILLYWANFGSRIGEEVDVSLTMQPMQVLVEERTEADWIRLLKSDQIDLYDVPENVISKPICLAAVRSQMYALSYVPPNLMDEEIIRAAAEINKDIVFMLPNKCLLDKDLVMIAFRVGNITSIARLPEDVFDKELSLLVVQESGSNLSYVPENLRDYDVCLAAVSDRGWTLRYVPTDVMDQKIVELAVEHVGSALRYVPWEMRTRELCLLALQDDNNAWNHVPKKFLLESSSSQPEEFAQNL